MFDESADCRNNRNLLFNVSLVTISLAKGGGNINLAAFLYVFELSVENPYLLIC